MLIDSGLGRTLEQSAFSTMVTWEVRRDLYAGESVSPPQGPYPDPESKAALVIQAFDEEWGMQNKHFSFCCLFWGHTQ